MSNIERCLGNLLSGHPPTTLPIPNYDFTSKAALARSHQRPLMLNSNLAIIVVAVIVDDRQRVVLIQEAKETCRGQWYLPAGRADPNETIQEAVKREVLEETGLGFEPTTIVLVESNHLFGFWIRFTFVGHITGGSLKSLKDEDKESLQAKWFDIQDIHNQVGIKLRARDITALIQAALLYLQRAPTERHAPILPVHNSHENMCIRVVIVKRIHDEIYVLLCMEGSPHFPTVKGTSMAEEALRTIDKETFSASNGYFLRGLLCVEHLGRPHGLADGVCLNLLAVTDFQRELKDPRYVWYKVINPDIKLALRDRIQPYRCLKCS